MSNKIPHIPKRASIKNLIFPIEFDHFTGGMIHSVMSLAMSLKKDYNVYLLAHKEAEVFKIDKEINSLALQKAWSISLNSPLKTFKTYLEVRKLMKSFSSAETIVFTNNVGSELIFSGFGFFPINLKRIFVSRGGDYSGKTGWIIRRGFKSIHHFVCISKRQEDILKRMGVEGFRIKLIHNGVKDLSISQYQFSKKSSVQLSVIGYINSQKNQKLIIEALNILRDNLGYNFVLNIYGDSTDSNYLKELLALVEAYELEGNVILHGFVKNRRRIYENSDILISSSISEGFGRTVAEAMAFGIPCIGLKQSGGLLDVITHSFDGFLIDNDCIELSNAIIRICEDDVLRNEISQNAKRTYSSRFTEDIMIKKYKIFLQRITM